MPRSSDRRSDFRIPVGLLLVLSLSSACSTLQPRDGASPAVVHGADAWEGGIGGRVRQVRIVRVDGKETTTFLRGLPGHVSVAPGRHTLLAGYFANGEAPSTTGEKVGRVIAGAVAPAPYPELLAEREFTFDAEAGSDYLVRFDTAVWDAQRMPIWMQEESTGRVVGSSQTLSQLSGTAFYQPMTASGFRRGVFVIAVDSEPLKPVWRGSTQDVFPPVFLTPGRHTIDVADISSGRQPPTSTTGKIVDTISSLPVISLFTYPFRFRKEDTVRHQLTLDAREGLDYLVRFDTASWDAKGGSIWLEPERNSEAH